MEVACYQRFEETYFLRLRPWRWRRFVRPKRLYHLQTKASQPRRPTATTVYRILQLGDRSAKEHGHFAPRSTRVSARGSDLFCSPTKKRRPRNHVGNPHDDIITYPDGDPSGAKAIDPRRLWRHWRHSRKSKVMSWWNKQPPKTTCISYCLILIGIKIRSAHKILIELILVIAPTKSQCNQCRIRGVSPFKS
jgi:hypothetical protein